MKLNKVIIKKQPLIFFHSPALASRRGIGEYPPLSTAFGTSSSSPRGRGSDHDITPSGQEVHPTVARKHPVTERSEVAVPTSVRGPLIRKWAGGASSERAGASRGGPGGRRLAGQHEKGDFHQHPFKSVMTQATLSVIDRAGRRLINCCTWWFGAGIPGHVLFSSTYCRIWSSVIRYSLPTRTACRRLSLIISLTVFALIFSSSATSSVV